MVTKMPTLRSKIEEYVESAEEYSEHHKEYIKVIEQLNQEEEITLKRRLAARR